MKIAKTVSWIPTNKCIPPHRVGRPEQVEELSNYFAKFGWDLTKEALIGYKYKGKIQLLSGSHRWAAANQVKLELIPVCIIPVKVVKDCWGNVNKWKELMKPVKSK